MTHLRRLRLCAPLLSLLAACPPSPAPSDAPSLDAIADATALESGADAAPDAPSPTVTVRMDFTASAGFYGAPFPSEHRRSASGVRVNDLPGAQDNDYVRGLLQLVSSYDGFGTTSAVFFALTGPVDGASLPDDTRGLATNPSVVLVPLEGPQAGQRAAAQVSYQRNGGPYGAPYLLSVLPLQGVPLRPATLYAAVVLRTVRDQLGRPLDASPTVAMLQQGTAPGLDAATSATYRGAFGALASAGIAAETIAGLTVFRTGSPAAALRRARAQLESAGALTLTSGFTRADVFPGFCVYNATLRVQGYQRGAPPYDTAGGDWVTDAQGNLVSQRTEMSRLVVTIPRATMPAEGYPLVVMVRTGGGGDRPLVDRGVQGMTGGPALQPGSGPAMEFASVGWAGAQWDGPLGGLRNSTGGDEQFLVFNVQNPAALRDNVRQSSLEAALLPQVLAGARIDVTDCPGASVPAGTQARFDLRTLTLMGHSMGATIAPPAAAVQPAYRALLLSGCGGSYIQNVLYKEHPVRVLPVANALVGYGGSRTMQANDPALNLFQWAAEPSDTPVYADTIVPGDSVAAPRHVLMMQGIVDHYIMPPIANTASLSMGLDLAGPGLDATTPEVMMLPSVASQLGLVGRRALMQPVLGNRMFGATQVTAVLRQYPEDGVEDGHEVVFQRPEPKHDYRCFLRSLAMGTPRLPLAGTGTDCN